MERCQENPIELERRHPERNMARFYALEIERDLFGHVVGHRRWGRIGTRGRDICVAYSSMDAALQAHARLDQAKRGRGYVDRPA